MEFRSEAAAYLGAAALALTFHVTYERMLHDRQGTLEIANAGVSFLETADRNPRQAFSWAWSDIQRFELSENHIRILSYKDRLWLAGADQPFDFRLPDDSSWREMYDELRARLDSRFVARVAGDAGPPVWEMPVKLRNRSEGDLTIGRELIVYRTRQHGGSRTWRAQDIENISTSGEFDLQIQSPEGSYSFQLKRPLPDAVYERVWLRLNQSKGLQVLNQPTEMKQ